MERLLVQPVEPDLTSVAEEPLMTTLVIPEEDLGAVGGRVIFTRCWFNRLIDPA